jgi:hypothetical protein
MPFSRSSLLFWTVALRSNDEAMTRRKRQKEQREIFLRAGEQSFRLLPFC